MILGLGLDVFEVSRMEQALRTGDPGLESTLFTTDEISFCRRQHRPAEHYSACFAVKEATFKALALDDRRGASWHDVELHMTPDGARSVLLHGRLREFADRKGVVRVIASVSHTRGFALASAILER